MKYFDGRINSIIEKLETENKKQISQLSTEIKLKGLCNALCLSYDDLDELIALHSPVLRTVKGHCFEVAFQQILSSNGYKSKDVGGDGDIDIVVNGHDLQLKTPNMSGTSSTQFEYKTHKTHGAKSEIESMDYYHRVDDFAEFFVGLISYKPFNVFIIPKQFLPRHPNDERYIKSPFKIGIGRNNRIRDFSKYVNNYSLIGISLRETTTSIHPQENELLPLTAKAIGVNSDIIVDSILCKANFRIWDMSIRGFAREFVVKKALEKHKYKFSMTPTKYKSERGEKADVVIWDANKSIQFAQVKGVSTGECKIDGLNSKLVVETRLTRGRYNDHPTQSRLYRSDDFDYLMIGLDPALSKAIYGEWKWLLFYIPSTLLERFESYPNRYSPFQYFNAKDIQKYLFTTYG